MKITIIALGSRGDVQPYAVLGKSLVAAGHRISFITTENFSPVLLRHGMVPEPLPGDAERVVREAGANMAALTLAFSRIATGIFVHAKRILPVLAESDMILNQLPLGAYGFDIAEKYGIPMWRVATIPMVRTSAFPMMGWPGVFTNIPGYNRFSYDVSELLAWLLLKKQRQHWRSRILGLPVRSRRSYFDQLHKMPVLHGFSSHIVPSPQDWPSNVFTSGDWIDPQPDWQPPDELMYFLDSGSPPVFIGFGSMPIASPQATTELILQALVQTKQRAILHSGWGSIGSFPLPNHIYQIEYAPYDWLFPRMSALIHHGGSGTTAAGFRSGVPTLVTPFLFDQRFWGDRIAQLGTGLHPIPFKKLTNDALADAIRVLVNNSMMQARAAELGEKLCREDGLQAAINLISQSPSP